MSRKLSGPYKVKHIDKSIITGFAMNVTDYIYSEMILLCRLRSIAAHRDHFVRRPSVCLFCS